MLTKRQALLFFMIGTFLFSVIFVILSFDTVKRGIPKKTHEENMTAAVVKGRVLWDRHNCMGCHTLMGEGAYYAPELTKVYERRGPGYIKAVLMSKAPWAPHGRKMVAYGFSEEEADNLVAFLKWIGEADLNGFPPKPKYRQEIEQ